MVLLPKCNPCCKECEGSCSEEYPCPEGCYCCDEYCHSTPCDCYCPDICSFRIQIVSPAGAAIKSKAFNCLGAPSNQVTKDLNSSLFLANPPSGTRNCLIGSDVSAVLLVLDAGPYGSSGFSASLDESAQYCAAEVEDDNVLLLSTSVQASATYNCTTAGGLRKPYIDLSISVLVTDQTDLGLNAAGQLYASKFVNKTLRYYPGYACEALPNRQCLDPSDPSFVEKFNVLQTPLEFTVTGSGTSVGAYSQVSASEGPGTVYSLIADTFDEILENLSVTFRITSRETCDTFCCCEGTTFTQLGFLEDCEGTVLTPADPPIDIEDISIVVDWDGFVLNLVAPYFGASDIANSTGFSCTPSVEQGITIQADRRTMIVNAFPQTGCYGVPWFSMNIALFFFNSQGGQMAQFNSGAEVSECMREVTVETTSDTDDSPIWCEDHPHGPITITMVIAP